MRAGLLHQGVNQRPQAVIAIDGDVVEFIDRHQGVVEIGWGQLLKGETQGRMGANQYLLIRRLHKSTERFNFRAFTTR
ncbi:hypothetical protein D3C73_1154640 [compost metagenome]